MREQLDLCIHTRTIQDSLCTGTRKLKKQKPRFCITSSSYTKSCFNPKRVILQLKIPNFHRNLPQEIYSQCYGLTIERHFIVYRMQLARCWQWRWSVARVAPSQVFCQHLVNVFLVLVLTQEFSHSYASPFLSLPTGSVKDGCEQESGWVLPTSMSQQPKDSSFKTHWHFRHRCQINVIASVCFFP